MSAIVSQTKSLSFDELGVPQIDSISMDDSTVRTHDTKNTEIAAALNGQHHPKLTAVSYDSALSKGSEKDKETVEDVRAWAKEASFKLKSFNYKIPGDSGSPYRSKQPPVAPHNNIPRPTSTTATNEKKITITEAIAVPQEPLSPQNEEQDKADSVVEVQNSNNDADENKTTTDNTDENNNNDDNKETTIEEKPAVPTTEEGEEDGDDDEAASQLVLSNTESGEDLDDYEDDDEEEEQGGDGTEHPAGRKPRRVKPVTHLPPTEDSAPINYIFPLNHVDAALSPNKPPPAPVTPLFEAKKQTLKAVVPNAHKQPQQSATSVQTFLNFNPKNKKILGNSRDSMMSSLSRSEDEEENDNSIEGLTIQSEPYRKRKPTERPVTDYETLVRINKLKDYGDFLESELETYLSNEEFVRIFGKSRVSD
jgi:hypothetical protein